MKKWRCLLCAKSVWCTLKDARRHEKSVTHTYNVQCQASKKPLRTPEPIETCSDNEPLSSVLQQLGETICSQSPISVDGSVASIPLDWEDICNKMQTTVPVTSVAGALQTYAASLHSLLVDDTIPYGDLSSTNCLYIVLQQNRLMVFRTQAGHCAWTAQETELKPASQIT